MFASLAVYVLAKLIDIILCLTIIYHFSLLLLRRDYVRSPVTTCAARTVPAPNPLHPVPMTMLLAYELFSTILTPYPLTSAPKSYFRFVHVATSIM